MNNNINILARRAVEQARQRRLIAMHLQDTAGNPLDAEQVSMFEMFERKGWSHEKRRAYIIDVERRRLIVG